MRDLNESARPRVLVMVHEAFRQPVMDVLKDLSGTQRIIENIGEVDSSEWDAIVMMGKAGSTFGGLGQSYTSRYIPMGLKILALVNEFEDFTDVIADENESPLNTIYTVHAVGKRASIPANVEGDLEDLVKRSLVPVVAARQEQVGVKLKSPSDAAERGSVSFEPVLIGPNDLAYAARYERAPGSHAWIIPADLEDFRPWLTAIFKEWHAVDPETFFGAPDWIEDDMWLTAIERAKQSEIDRAVRAFEAAQAEHEVRLSELTGSFSALRDASARHERLLLNGQGIELQNEVRDALREIGFDVEDMDPIWHEREPREDYRIRDNDEPGWMVIADATGTTKGVRGTKLMTTQRFVTRYVAENGGGDVPSFWLIANHFADREPGQRPPLLRGDELAAVEIEGNLVIDTVALFHIVMAVRSDPSLKGPVRAMMRSAVGALSGEAAREWVSENKSS